MKQLPGSHDECIQGSDMGNKSPFRQLLELGHQAPMKNPTRTTQTSFLCRPNRTPLSKNECTLHKVEFAKETRGIIKIIG